MLPVTWGDSLSLRWKSSKTNKISLSARGLKLPQEKNLAYRAAQEFSRAFKKNFELKMELVKKIPTGAGLGGGSGNAAYVLRTLARIYKIPLNKKLLKVAKSLGADVPFFLYGHSAWCTGVGEICRPISTPSLHFVIVVSRKIPVPTPLAYGALDRARGKLARSWKLKGMPDYLTTATWTIPALENDFEAVVLEMKPALKRVKAALVKAGAMAAAMSGSGSSFFGVFKDFRAAKRAASQLRSQGYEAIACSSLSNWTN